MSSDRVARGNHAGSNSVGVVVRRIGAFGLALMVGALTWLGAGAASADKPLPGVFQYSNNIMTFGDHDFCHGAINVKTTTPKGKRGVIRTTYTSLGFTGNQPGWKRNPKCTVLVGVLDQGDVVPPYHEEFVRLSFGPRPGERVVRDFVTGSGPRIINFFPYAINNPVRVPQGYGLNFWTIVP